MARKATQQDYKDFYESLTPKQLKIVKQADELWFDFFEERLAKEAFDEWDKAGRPKGIPIDKAKAMTKKLRNDKEYYLSLPYQAIIEKDDGCFVAHYAEYPKITGVGDSEDDALSELREAFECLIVDCLLSNEPIKEPKNSQIP
jgi:predicted RNase H-like HicB family nuclease